MTPTGAAAHGARARRPVLVLALLASAAVSGGAHAESMYVIEQLVVGVNSAPGGSGDKVATIKSGDRVELLGRQRDEAQIQLPNGTSGWVKASYLSTQEPLQRRLQDRSAEVAKLEQDVSRLESQLAARPGGAQRPPGPLAARKPDTGQAVSAPASENGLVRDPSPFMTPREQPGQAPWTWVLGSSAVALVVGFIAGWRMLDRSIRRKYGGLRIY